LEKLNKLSGNDVVCFKYEYVLFLLSAVTVLDLSMKCRPWWCSFD